MPLKKVLILISPIYVFSAYSCGSHELDAQLQGLLGTPLNYYYENKAKLTPKELGRIEFGLKTIITNKNSTPESLAKSTLILFVLDCRLSHKKALNMLFNRQDFNAAFYTRLQRDIRKLKVKK